MPKAMGVIPQIPALAATPAGNPPSGALLLYFKSDGKLYQKDSAGGESQVDTGGGGGIDQAVVDAKGDLLVATAADTVARKAVGANGTVLTADSTQADGVAWTALAADIWTATVKAVRVATTANIALSGVQTIDDVALTAGDRVLVRNQTNPAQNGIYNALSGAWTRATDADTSAECQGMVVYVVAGTTYAGSRLRTSWRDTDVLGTTPMTFTEVSSYLGLATPGDIQMYGRAAPADGWMPCDGAAVSRPILLGGTTDLYASLWTVIETSFGTGDGSTTFGLPDLRRRVPVGVGTGVVLGRDEGLDGNALEPNRTFAHDHSAAGLSTAAANMPQANNTTASGSQSRLTGGGFDHSHSVIGRTANTAYNDMPHLALNFTIKL